MEILLKPIGNETASAVILKAYAQSSLNCTNPQKKNLKKIKSFEMRFKWLQYYKKNFYKRRLIPVNDKNFSLIKIIFDENYLE